MSSEPRLDAYLCELRSRLALCPGRTEDVIDEARDHLRESRDAAIRAGADPASAEQQAIEEFGEAVWIARQLTVERSGRRARRLLPVALALGLGLAWIDSRPTWDDTGVSAFAVLIASGSLAMFEPMRPWLWALAIAGWFPAIAIATSGNWGAFAALAFGFAGAFAGSCTRRSIATRRSTAMCVSLVSILGVLASRAGAQAPDERVDAFMKEELSASGVPGASVAVVRDGKVVLEKGYGLANVELRVPADANTVYELLSVSKQFTAVAVMTLIEAKKLALDDRIIELLDGLPAAWSEVTIAELLSHCSGIPDYTEQPGWIQTLRTERSPRDLLETVESTPLVFPPGTAWKYSNSNYYLLGLLIEKVTSLSFDDYVAAHLLEPLGMRTTRLESFEEIIANRAAGYHREQQATFNAPWIDPSQKWAAGAFVSCVDDLARWAIELDAHTLLPAEVYESMVAPAELSDGRKVDYGFANELDLDHGHRVAGHQGGGLAFNATLLHYPDDRTSVVVLANMTQAPSRTWARQIASFWIEGLDLPEVPVADPDPAFTVVFQRVLAEAATGKVDSDPFASDVRQELVAFIERAGPQFLRPLGELESLTPVAPPANATPRTRCYCAKFARRSITWIVELDAGGKIQAMDPRD